MGGCGWGWVPVKVRGRSDDGKVVRQSSGRVKSQKYSELDIGGSETCLPIKQLSFVQTFKTIYVSNWMGKTNYN